LLNCNTYELIEMQQADDVSDNAVSYSAIFNFLDVTPGNSCIVKMSAVDTNDNITSPKEIVDIFDTPAPVINHFLVYSSEIGTINVGVDVSDDSGRVVAISFLYWKEEPNNELDSLGIPLTNGQGNMSFTDLDIGKTLSSYSSGTPRGIHDTPAVKGSPMDPDSQSLLDLRGISPPNH
jgi:hypothetical protein